MSRRTGIVDASQFDFQNFPTNLGSAPTRHDSADFENKEVHFGSPGLSRKRSSVRFYDQRNDDWLSDTPVRRLRRKRRLSNLRHASEKWPSETPLTQMTESLEHTGVRSLRRSLSKAALRLIPGKRKHEECDLDQTENDDFPPTKRARLPITHAHMTKWSGSVEKALDVIVDEIEVALQHEDYVLQERRNPNFNAARSREWEAERYRTPMLAPSARRSFPHPHGVYPLEPANTRLPLPARHILLSPPCTKGAGLLDMRQAGASTSAILEGRESERFQPLVSIQRERIHHSPQPQDVHPALRHPDPLGCHPLDSGYHSRQSSGDNSTYPTIAMLETAIQEQYEVMGVPFGGPEGNAKMKRLRQGLDGFGSWDEFASAVAEH